MNKRQKILNYGSIAQCAERYKEFIKRKRMKRKNKLYFDLPI